MLILRQLKGKWMRTIEKAIYLIKREKILKVDLKVINSLRENLTISEEKKLISTLSEVS